MALSKPTNAQLTTSASTFSTSASDDAFIFGTDGNDLITGGTVSIDSAVSDGTDTMAGGLGDDTYIVRDTTDVVTELAGEGTDTIWSSVSYTLGAEVENIGANGSADITLTGNAKDNVLDSTNSTGVVTMNGGAGNDAYFLGAGDKIIDTGGIDTLYLPAGSGSLDLTNATTAAVILGGTAAQQAATVAGIENVVLQGTVSANLTGNALNNHLTGNGGNNQLTGAAGNDTLDTGAGGTDVLIGGAGDDTYILRNASTFSYTITEAAAAGTDSIVSYVASSLDLNLISNIENVYLQGSSNVNVTGNAAANILSGNAGNNNLDGGVGADKLIGGGGTNILVGGDGNDTYVVVSVSDTITETSTATSGTDTVQFNGISGTLSIGANVETVTLGGTSNIGVTVASATTKLATITGNAGNNTLTGGDGNDNINGGAGDDTLSGGAGTDTLTGGAGTNIMDGGDGNDIYNVTSNTDTVSETNALAAGGANDIVHFNGTASTTLTVGANIETIFLDGALATGVAFSAGVTTNHTITGNIANNSITGAGGADNINGGVGADTMSGGAGNDVFAVDNIGDSVVGGANFDVVNITYTAATVGGAGSTFTMEGTVEQLNMLGSVAYNGTGNAANNLINGNALDNIISGLGGSDTINAGVGNDTVIGGLGKDLITLGTGNDIAKFAFSGTGATTASLDSVAADGSITGVDSFSDLTLTAATADKIQLIGLTVGAVNATALTGSLNEPNFIANMNALLSAAPSGQGFNQSAGIDVAVVTGNDALASLNGRTFLAVDVNADNAFTTADLVIELTGTSDVSAMTAASFIA